MRTRRTERSSWIGLRYGEGRKEMEKRGCRTRFTGLSSLKDLEGLVGQNKNGRVNLK